MTLTVRFFSKLTEKLCLSTEFRTPYFARKICDGSYARSDIQRKIRELYDDSLETDGTDFVGAIADALSDFYDYQRLSKRISSGELTFFIEIFVIEPKKIDNKFLS